MEIRELLNHHGFPGDETPIIKGSALKAMEAGIAGKLDDETLATLLDQKAEAEVYEKSGTNFADAARV